MLRFIIKVLELFKILANPPNFLLQRTSLNKATKKHGKVTYLYIGIGMRSMFLGVQNCYLQSELGIMMQLVADKLARSRNPLLAYFHEALGAMLTWQSSSQ